MMTWTDKRYHTDKSDDEPGYGSSHHYGEINRPGFWGWPFRVAGGVMRGVAGVLDGGEERRQGGRRAQRYNSGEGGARILGGFSSPDEEDVRRQQMETKGVLRLLFGPEDPAQPDNVELNPDGKPGPATNGTIEAVNEFLKTMLGDKYDPHASIEQNTAQFGKMMDEVHKDGVDPKVKEEFDNKFSEARDIAQKAIQDINVDGNPPPNGFTRREFGEAAPAAEKPVDSVAATTAVPVPLTGSAAAGISADDVPAVKEKGSAPAGNASGIDTSDPPRKRERGSTPA